MHILNLQKRNEANPCSGFYGFFLLDVIGFWRIFQLIPWLLTISQHTSSSDVCLSFYLIGLSILKGKASEFLDMELPVLSVPVKSSNLRSESRKLCPVHLVTQVKATVESLINVFFFYFLSCSIFGTTTTPCFGDWRSVNSSQLAATIYCHQLLLLIEVSASRLHTNISLSFFSPLINVCKIPELWHKLSFAMLAGLWGLLKLFLGMPWF